MNDRHAKIWLSVFVFTLMTVGSAASYFAQGKTFYKGTERQQKTINSKQLYTSVLNTETESAESAPELNFKAPATVEEKVQAKTQPISSPCINDERPIIKNGQISGCTSRTEPKIEPQKAAIKISASLPPGPKVRIFTEPPTSYNLTCESQGLFTYTGPDRPGLLYGMCIECETNQYIIQGGKCS